MKTFSVKNFEKFQHYKDRAPPWIKLYNGLLEDYEFGLLPDASKMHLIAIWLLASRSDNKIPYDAKWVAGRINASEAVDLELLTARGFIVPDQGVQQVASKPSAECLTREEGQDQEIEKRKEEYPPVAKATRPASSSFEEFWKEYPKRDGDNPRKPAEKKFNALVKTGVDPEVMISGARKASADARARAIYGTKFVPQAIKWLNDQRFHDYAVAAASSVIDDGLIEVLGEEELQAWDNHARATGRKTYPRNSRGGWRFPSRWPPGHVPVSSSRADPPPSPILRTMQ